MVDKQTRTIESNIKNTRATARKFPKYTYPQKIQAVTIMAAHGGVTIEAIAEIKRLFNIPSISTETLFNWNKQYKQLVLSSNAELQPKEIDVAKLVAETRQSLLVNLSSTVQKAATHLNKDSTIDAMSGRDAAVVVGIATDKLLLMAGRKPELDNLLQRLITALDGTQHDPIHILEDLVTVAERKKQELLDTIKAKELNDGNDQ